MRKGFLYLVAAIDWHSRFVVSWRLSSSMDTSFCTEALNDALNEAVPTIFNTDQGSQFTSTEFTDILKQHNVQISMDGKGRYLDSIYRESLAQSQVRRDLFESIRGHKGGTHQHRGLFPLLHFDRPHQALGYLTPWEVYRQKQIDPEKIRYGLAESIPHMVSMNTEMTPAKN